MSLLWALGSAMILKGTFSSFHPVRCYCSSEMILGFSVTASHGYSSCLFAICHIFLLSSDHCHDIPSPIAEFFLCSVPCESKPGGVTLSRGLCWVPALISERCSLVSHTQQALTFPLLLLLAQAGTPCVSVGWHCSGPFWPGSLCL